MSDTHNPGIPDAAQRQLALDPAQSFIVQAPAGSGKTGLLAQRLLRLLAIVEQPEEILAMTFTRKAVAEMRTRVLEALHNARYDPEPTPQASHQHQTWQLARAALRRDAEQGWELLEHPTRLRIRTMDGLNHYLVRQLPLLSGMGVPPEAVDDARPLYQQAVRQTLNELEREGEPGESLFRVLGHVGNNMAALEGLLMAMLAVRDQWLRHLTRHAASASGQALGGLDRAVLEQALSNTVQAHIDRLPSMIDEDLATEWLAIARYAAINLLEQGSDSAITHCRHLDRLPDATQSGLAGWQGLIDLVLTAKTSNPGWRRSVDKRQGFLAQSDLPDTDAKAQGKQFKDRLTALIEALKQHPGLLEALNQLRLLPPVSYQESQWQVLQALFQVLVYTAANLSLVIRDRGQADHIAIARAAIDALGSPEAPSELALSLDYRIQHLLIDEFQDTSRSQWELLKGLIAGWQPGDGHSLFIVGDPMQSIYRFRQAEVALFERARNQGIAGLKPLALQLLGNFRSQAPLIEWVNHQFATLFSADSALNPAGDESSGASSGGSQIRYQASVACASPNPLFGDAAATRLHGFDCDQPDHYRQEALRVVEIIESTRRTAPEASIAILVRGRSHLDAIMPALREAQIAFQAVDIDSLASRSFISDLLMLTRALLHFGDRIAWLALLRSPMCGLTLNELEPVSGRERHASIWHRLPEQQARSARIQRFVERLTPVLRQRGLHSLRTWVHQAWIALGGPACLNEADSGGDPQHGQSGVGSTAAWRDIERYFGLLDELSSAGDIEQIEALEEAVDALKATPPASNPADSPPAIQIMTIHKAKGLEFDVVILPGLARRPPNPERRLLYWHESVTAQGLSELILAPVKAHDQQDDPASDWIKHLDKEQETAEHARLLYVATTRARQQLHLLASLGKDKKGERSKPVASSLLALLWPQLELRWPSTDEATPDQEGQSTPVPRRAQSLRRLSDSWTPPTLARDIPTSASEPLPHPDIEYSWASELARLLGSVVHRCLEEIGSGQRDLDSDSDLHAMLARSKQVCHQAGVMGQALADASDKVEAILTRIRSEPRARWILDPAHQDSRCEWALTAVIDGQPRRFVLDRSFIDEQGTRWIIDYKTGGHEGGAIETFLDSEQLRYRSQLENYANIVKQLDPSSPIRLALYFPLIGAWREWG